MVYCFLIFGYHQEGRIDEARSLNDRLQLLHKSLFLESNPIPVNKAMSLMGMSGKIQIPHFSSSSFLISHSNEITDGGIRPPLTELSQDHLSALQDALVTNGCL